MGCEKNGWYDLDAVWGLTHGSNEPCIRWGPEPHGNGHFLGGTCASQCNVPPHECIVHCSPAAAGESACQAHAAGECICRHDGDKTVMRPFATLLVCY